MVMQNASVVRSVRLPSDFRRPVRLHSVPLREQSVKLGEQSCKFSGDDRLLENKRTWNIEESSR